MEPLNTTVRFDGDRAEVWAGSQFQTIDQAAIAEVLGLQAGAGHVSHRDGRRGLRPAGHAGFARPARGRGDREAPARHVRSSSIWTREDDVRGGYYRPMHVHRVEIGIGADGMPAAWRHVIVGQSLLAGTPFAAMHEGRC